MDIGSLTGSISIEDQLSTALDYAAGQVRKFADDFEGALGGIAIGVGVGVAALGAMAAAVTALGVRGADINDVASTLDHFAGSADNAAEILEKMRKGTLGTVEDFDLMKSSSKLLAAGVKLSADNFGTLSDAAFMLQNQGLGPTKDMLDMVSQALLTGRTRALEMKIGKMDLSHAEADYARTLGVAADQLSAVQKTEAKRTAILGALADKVKETGAAHRDFGEQIEFAETQFKNLIDDVSAGVAKSSVLMAAMDTLGEAIGAAFGEGNKTAVETVVSIVEHFAIILVDVGITAVETARVFHVAWSLVKSVILGVESGLITMAAAVTSAYAAVAKGGTYLPGATEGTRQLAAEAKTSADGMWALAKGMDEETKKAALGITGHSDFDKTLDKMGGTLFKTRDAMLAATNAQTDLSTVTKQGKIEEDAITKATAAHQKAVQALVDTIEGHNKKEGDMVEALQQVARNGLVVGTAAADRFRKAVADLVDKGVDVPPLLRNIADDLRPIIEGMDLVGLKTGDFGVTLDKFGHEASGLMDQVDLLSSSINEFHKGVSIAGDEVKNVTIPAFSTLPDVTAQATDAIDEMSKSALTLGDVLSHNLTSVLTNLPNMFVKAFTGGGGIAGAFKAIGVQLAESILQPLLKGLNVAQQKAIGIASAVSAGVGGAVGGSGGAMVGGLATTAAGLVLPHIAALAASSVALGAATMGIGLAAVAVYKLWSNWKAHKEMVEANTKSINQFTDSMFAMASKSQVAEAGNQRWALTLIEVRDAYLKTGRTAAQAEEDVKAMWDAAKKGPAETQAAMDKINQAFIESRQQAEAFAAAMSDFQQTGANNFNSIAAALDGDKASLESLNAMAMTTYATLVAGGMSSAAALGAIQPGLDSLVHSYEALGINITDAGLASLLMQANIAKNNPTLIAGIDALANSMSSMEKLGLMNASSFGLMEIAGTSMYAKLQAAAEATGGGTADALIPMQGYLHAAADEAVKLGVPLDDNTQMLIDQSVELGIWKDQGKSATDTMIDSMNKLVASVQSLVDVMNNIPRDLTITTHHVDVAEPATNRAGGGVIYAAGGANILPFTRPSGTDTVNAMLTPGERVLTVSQNEQYTRNQNDNSEVIAELQQTRAEAAQREANAERRVARIVRDEVQKIAR